VTRVTVYRHFPDETAVFQACTAHWLQLNPPPDPQAWMKEEGALERVRRAVAAFHRYYADTSDVWAAAHRDAPEVPALQAPMAAFGGYLEEVTKGLMRALRARRNRRLLEATLGHVLAFETWASLESRGLDDARKADLVMRWVAALL
jgi:AcrR family transcriptional regulator